MHLRSTMRALILVFMLMAGLFPATAAARPPDNVHVTKEVKQLIETYGPVIVSHPGEEYFLDTPEAILDGPSRLYWGIIENEDNAQEFTQEILGWTETTTDTLLADVAAAKQHPRAGDPRFRYWLDVDPSLWSGHQQRAKAYVRVWPESELILDLQFWFFSPYNGPVKGKATVSIPGLQNEYQYYYPDTVGRHSGDWEHVTLRFERENVGEEWSLARLFLSQHSSGQWVDVDSAALSFVGTHPIVYRAKDSHAHYASTGEHPYLRVLSESFGPVTLTVDLVDLTDEGAIFEAYRPGNYRIVSSALPDVKTTGARDWLEYDGRWGAYERLSFTGEITIGDKTYPFPFDEVGNGPTGPAQKDAWIGQYP